MKKLKIASKKDIFTATSKKEDLIVAIESLNECDFEVIDQDGNKINLTHEKTNTIRPTTR